MGRTGLTHCHERRPRYRAGVSDAELFAPSFGQHTEFDAVLVFDPLRAGRNPQATQLLRDDGDSWIVAYRPVTEWLCYADQRVRVRGRPYWPSEHVQHVMATHFEVESLELAPGAVAIDPVPLGVPPPPVLRELGAVQARTGRWVLAVGTLARLAQVDTYRSEGELLLNGEEIRVVHHGRGAPEILAGAVATLLGVVTRDDRGLILSASAICAGENPSCGLLE